MAKNSEKVAVYAAIRVERRTYVSPDILRLKPENMYVMCVSMLNCLLSKLVFYVDLNRQ